MYSRGALTTLHETVSRPEVFGVFTLQADECGELVSHLEALLDEQRARDRVSHLARELPPASLRAALPEGLALPHRRFLREGELRQSEASAEGAAAWQRRRAHLFNDILLLVDGGEAPREALGGEGGVASVECIGLAKATGGADGCGRWAEDVTVTRTDCEQVQVKVLADLDEPASEPRSEGGGFPFELSRVDGKRSWRLSAGSAEERAP